LGSVSALAVHIGADLLTGSRQARWAPVNFCADTIARMSRLCARADIRTQCQLVGRRATRAEVRAALELAVGDLDPDGLLVVTYTGHSDRRDRDSRGQREVSWCLYDGELPLADVAGVLSRLAATSYVIVVSDTCYAAALSRYDIPATLVVLGACGADQQSLARPGASFASRIEQLIVPAGVLNPDGNSFAWLHQQLRSDTPDVERPGVWPNRVEVWTDRPFARRSALT